MKALCWYGPEDVRVDTVPDPKTIATFYKLLAHSEALQNIKT